MRRRGEAAITQADDPGRSFQPAGSRQPAGLLRQPVGSCFTHRVDAATAQTR